jgi:hypothetical protein
MAKSQDSLHKLTIIVEFRGRRSTEPAALRSYRQQVHLFATERSSLLRRTTHMYWPRCLDFTALPPETHRDGMCKALSE